jgi:hypothetical protein
MESIKRDGTSRKNLEIDDAAIYPHKTFFYRHLGIFGTKPVFPAFANFSNNL